YIFVESFGSVIMAFFWAFVADSTTPDSARRGYAIIALFGQIGNIAGALLVEHYAESWGTGLLAGCAGVGIFLLIPLMIFFNRTIPLSQLRGFRGSNEKIAEKADQRVDFGEGLGLMLARPYLLGIFA